MNFLEKVRNCNVLIIGDVMIDTYLNGRVARISPEAPVPVVEFQSRVERLGGAANVALNVKALDAIPILLSVVEKMKMPNFLVNYFKMKILIVNISFNWRVVRQR